MTSRDWEFLRDAPLWNEVNVNKERNSKLSPQSVP